MSIMYNLYFIIKDDYIELTKNLLEQLTNKFIIDSIDCSLNGDTLFNITKGKLNKLLESTEFKNCTFYLDSIIQDCIDYRFYLAIEPSRKLIYARIDNWLLERHATCFLKLLENLCKLIHPEAVYLGDECNNLNELLTGPYKKNIVSFYSRVTKDQVDLSKQIKKIIEKYRKKSDEKLAEEKK